MKKFLTVVLTMVFTLSMAGMAMAANTNPTATPATGDTNYVNYPNGYGAGAGGLKTGITAIINDDLNDNKLINANQTGVGVGGQTPMTPAEKAVKNVVGQRTHGEYANNTNSCASCHQVHTAAAENLLFKDGVYQTCTACHDGTLGVFNVFAGSTAGTFGGTSVGNASMHLANGVMEVKAAPGGNHNAIVDTKGNDLSKGGAWAGEFNCASCHSPHGSYSDRLLNYNPNGIGSTDMYFRATDGSFTDKDGNPSTAPVSSGGLKVAGVRVVDGVPALADKAAYDAAAEYILARTDARDAALDVKVTQENAGTQVIVLMKKGTKTVSGNTTYLYKRDITPWIGNVYNYRSGSPLEEVTNFFKTYAWGDANKNLGAAAPWNTVEFKADGSGSIVVKFAQAYVKGTGLSQVGFGDISRATLVKFQFLGTPKATFNGLPILETDVNTYSHTNAKGTSVEGFGVQISQFCAACHTDYFVSAGSDTKDALGNELGKGVWSKAFRHNTTSDSYTCLKCHFAHGTDVSVMLDAKDKSVANLVSDGMSQTDAETWMLDRNASSALKRYTNMSVCWKCHTSSHSEDLTNNAWYQGSLNSGVKGSSEFTATNDTNRPAGWVGPTQANLPYAGNHN